MHSHFYQTYCKHYFIITNIFNTEVPFGKFPCTGCPQAIVFLNTNIITIDQIDSLNICV